uniref:H15 domain-containing protein n=1 Tax=Salvator merianae TaxID=96440 RepID=A0A8D0B102_SALMN
AHSWVSVPGSKPGRNKTASATADESQRKTRLSASLSQLILQAFEACNRRKSLSLAALKKHLVEAGYSVNRKNNHRLKKELHALVSNGLLIRATGSGASGSFKAGSRSQARKKPGRSESVKGRKKMTPKKPVSRIREQPKQFKQRKKQPAVSKPKGLQGRPTGGANRKRQPKK